jgi:hypothetical protein
MSSTTEPETEMQAAKRRFLSDLRYVAGLVNEKGPDGFSPVRRLYKRSFEFGRQTHLNPNFRETLTSEDRDNFRQYFPTAISVVAGFSPGLVNHICPGKLLNVARTFRSEISFLQNEVFDLYKEVADEETTKDIEEALANIQMEDNCLEYNIESWIAYDGEDDIDDVPNLNGVPESHSWWLPEHRQHWANQT